MKGLSFATDLVPAVLDGSKSVTWRLMKPQPICQNHYWSWNAGTSKYFGWFDMDSPNKYPRPITLFAPYRVGEVRYLKEAIRRAPATPDWAMYVADGRIVPNGKPPLKWRWKQDFLPAIFLPEEASRKLLKIVSVRVGRVQSITYDDILMEGWDARRSQPISDGTAGEDARDWYAELCDKRYGKGSWGSNYWAWRYEFQRTEAK